MSQTRSQALHASFMARPLRDRRLLVIAVPLAALCLAFLLVIDPSLTQAASKQSLLAQQQQELATLEPQLASLRRQVTNPDAASRAALAETQLKIQGVEKDLHGFDNLLVTPGSMPRMLQSLLTRHRSLELVGLKTLPASPLLASKQAGAPAAGDPNVPVPASNARPSAQPPGSIYRHSIEITVAGSYADLLSYAEELQRISPRPLWSGMQLKVIEYPRSELTFILYTLSLDLPWLAV